MCDFRKFPRAFLQEATLMFQDECIVGMVQRRSDCTVSDPQIAQNRGASRRIFSTSSLSDGKVSSFKNDIIGSI